MKIKNKSHEPKLSQVIGLINPSVSSINTSTSTYNFIIDPMFPARETCSADIANAIFGRQFCISCEISAKNGLYEELSTINVAYILYTNWKL